MPVVPAEKLLQVGSDLFEAAGAPSDIATLVAESLIDANLAGHDSHGVIRITQYLQQIVDGELLPAERPRIVRDGPSVIQVDGCWGFGQLAARFCTDLAVERAKQYQLSAVGLGRSNHIGRLGEWTERAAASGTLCLVTSCSGSGPYVTAPYGGASRALSTNPLSFAAPVGDEDRVLVDFATTVIAMGKLRHAKAKGDQLPPNALTDVNGRPTTDPEDFFRGGALLPFAGHKGYGLAVMVELLSVALTGADAMDPKRAYGALFLCIDTAAFRADDGYNAYAEQLRERMVSSPPAEGFERVMMPGEPEQRAREARREAGIPVPDSTWELIQQSARQLGVAMS